MSADNEAFRRIERPEPIIRADALAHVVFERSDVDKMAGFLRDFGFLPWDADTDGQRYFRGYGAYPYSVEIIPSSRDAFVGFALVAREEADLERLAASEGVAIEKCEGPGGGKRVRLTDPDGRRVDLIHGFTPAQTLATRTELLTVNTPSLNRRVNETVRTPLEPTAVFRMGHVVLQTPNFDAVADWYMRRFGLIPTDVQTVGDGNPALGFFRLDRGSEPADHHSVALVSGPVASLIHVAAETLDIDAIGQGHQFLRARGWTHFWGIGRHWLGSQIFDYWKDPSGNEWEHYADGDVMTADYPTNYHRFSRGGLWAWGADLPDSMRPPEKIREQTPPRIRAVLEALQIPPRPWLR